MVKDAVPAGEASFQGKYKEEEFQFCFHQHWLRLVSPIARMAFFSLLLITGGFVMLQGTSSVDPGTRHVVLISMLVFFLFFQLDFLERLYNYFLYIIIVTDRRVHRIKKTLFVTNDQQSIDLWVIQDINKAQHGLIQVALGFGTLMLESQETMLRIHFVPGISKKYEKLVHLREQARRKWPKLPE